MSRFADLETDTVFDTAPDFVFSDTVTVKIRCFGVRELQKISGRGEGDLNLRAIPLLFFQTSFQAVSTPRVRLATNGEFVRVARSVACAGSRFSLAGKALK